MTERHERVVLKIDTRGFTGGFRRFTAAAERLRVRLETMPFTELQRPKHHRRESPAASAMHAAYDRRRRARRRRR